MSSRLAICMLLLAMTSASAKSFMEADSEENNTEDSGFDTNIADMFAVLLTEGHPSAASLTETVQAQHGKDSHDRNQVALEAMFNSLPKNDNGNLPLPAARYALHRLFEQRHRWLVRGLSPIRTTKEVAKDIAKSSHIGNALQTLTAMDNKGLTLAGLAALAGTLDQLIRLEVAGRLKDFFWSADVPDGDVDWRTRTVPWDKLEQMVVSYMTVYIAGGDFTELSKEGGVQVKEDEAFMLTITKDWPETKEWVKSVTQDVAKTETGCVDDLKECAFKFQDAGRVVLAVVEKYGFYNDRQCHQVKDKLLELAEPGTGRVGLAEFYTAGHESVWGFNEKVDYLRVLGTLDESTPGNPKVLVPNYVSSFPNCLSSSSFYSVCCRNECEDYMQVIEKRIAGPMADPHEIVRLIETHSVFTEAVPSNLPALRRRLISIADKNGGMIPLHGRLFAQWMHHAFPSTCPYPHEAGKTMPQTPDEWMSTHGEQSTKASEGEVEEVVNQAKSRGFGNWDANDKDSASTKPDQDTFPAGLPWTDTEELLVVRAAPQPESSGKKMADKLISSMEFLLVLALVGTVVWMAREHAVHRNAYNKGRYI